MISLESQRVVGQSEGFCPESCSFCPGVGLSTPFVNVPEMNSNSSCLRWPSMEKKDLNKTPLHQRRWFLPSKFLSGNSWARLENKFPENSSLVILIGDNNLTIETLQKVSNKFTFDIWIIPNRSFNIISVLSSLPEEMHERVRFYCPLYDENKDHFLTSQELVLLFKKIANQFPSLNIIPPEGIEIFNPTLSIEDLNVEEKILFDSSTSAPVDISVIIPSYNNRDYVCRVVRNLVRQQTAGISFEVTVIDDGSTDGTSTQLLDYAQRGFLPERFRLIEYPRSKNRKMGDFQFRAGRARILGVRRSTGLVYAFLDSDMLVPPNYIRHLYESHEYDDYDVVQIQRLYLKEEPSKALEFYDSVDGENDIFHPEGGYWKIFFEDPKPWQEMSHRWKYVCTYGLSVKAEKYHEVGGFKSVFNSYGFEDTDLGYRLAKSGAKFLKSPLEAFHLWHDTARSEFGNSPWKRQRLLGRSANIFFRHNLDVEVFQELESLLVENRLWRKRFFS